MNEKKYMIDSEPASANDLINAAKDLDCDYGRDGFFTTSGATKVLRDNGHTVGYNHEYKNSANTE